MAQPPKTASAVGKVTKVIGAVVDFRIDGHPPAILKVQPTAKTVSGAGAL